LRFVNKFLIALDFMAYLNIAKGTTDQDLLEFELLLTRSKAVLA
jgi:hypothetical protein